MSSKAFRKHQHAPAGQLLSYTVKRFAGRTRRLNLPFSTLLPDAVVMRVIDNLGRWKCAMLAPSRKWADAICIWILRTHFLPLKLSSSGWLSPLNSVCWHHCAAAVKGSEVLLSGDMDVLHHATSIALTCSLIYTGWWAVWHFLKMPLEPEIHLVLSPSVDTVEDLASVVSGRSSCDDVRQIMVGWERKEDSD